MYTCRECERPVNQATEVCPYCGADLTAPAAAEPEKPSNPWRAAALWGVVILALWGFLVLILPEGEGTPGRAAARAEAAALEALGVARGVLADHAAASGSFPYQLEAVATPALRAAAQRALAEGYRLEYQPGPGSDEGRIRSYALLARPGLHGHRNFFTDQTGVVRATRENRPATAGDPPL